jgi:hypothetical protein
MREFLEDAREELKRADHLIYVSLKYTRTVDVLESVVQRFINCVGFTIDGLLDYAVEKKKLVEKPTNEGLKCKAMVEIYGDEVKLMIDFYIRMRKILRGEHRKSSEYRRHVTMTTEIEEGTYNIDIDVSRELYIEVENYVKQAEVMIWGEQEED